MEHNIAAAGHFIVSAAASPRPREIWHSGAVKHGVSEGPAQCHLLRCQVSQQLASRGGLSGSNLLQSSCMMDTKVSKRALKRQVTLLASGMAWTCTGKAEASAASLTCNLFQAVHRCACLRLSLCRAMPHGGAQGAQGARGARHGMAVAQALSLERPESVLWSRAGGGSGGALVQGLSACDGLRLPLPSLSSQSPHQREYEIKLSR